MRGFNKAVIAGNLARDPEIRYTIDKRAWARFTVAVNKSFKNRNGEMQDLVDFIPVVVWGPMAENCGRYLKKGSSVLVEGRIQVSSYDAKDGSGKRYATDIVANDVVFLSSRGDINNSSSGEYSSPYQGSQNAPRQDFSQPSMPQFDPFPNNNFQDDQRSGFPDDGFGSSIDDRGFSGDFSPNFNSIPSFNNSSSDNGEPEADIPF